MNQLSPESILGNVQASIAANGHFEFNESPKEKSIYGNSIYVPSIPGVIQKFGVSTTLAISPISFYCLGQVLGPPITASLSEFFGRKWIMRVSIPTALLFTAIGGSAKNFETLVICRFLSSLAISPAGTVSVGIVNDMWDVALSKTGTLLALVIALMNLLPAAIGPSTGAALVATTDDWRWTFWLNAILLAFIVLLTFPVPETYYPFIAKKNTTRDIEKNDTGLTTAPMGYKHTLRVAFARPLHMMLEPIVILTSLACAILQAILFCWYIAYPVIFERVYRFSEREQGLAFLPILGGNILGVFTIGICDKLKYQKTREIAVQTGARVEPELRLYPACVGSITAPISIFWLAWTAKSQIHWIVPMLSGVLFGLSHATIAMTYTIYKNDIYGADYGASAFAGEVMLRYLFSAATPLFWVQAMNSLHINWSTSLLGFISLFLVPLPLIFFRYGPYLRSKSKYVPAEPRE
ncbi:MFS general substrate transporter [Penicillium cataractarum]|uniref:MFS general substrate transporter n=1 Tax=Penicillium cataractarum TaxID=2100454 RepID=A0A9W9V2C4_9EURO|nr:MFS general substrate transporter [Penicillium cataractarum]KAJ5363611.1 MFS general substrate transporter [Penicillium cataractarum]